MIGGNLDVSNYFIKEFFGSIDKIHQVRFTFATLYIDIELVGATLEEHAREFVNQVFKELRLKGKSPIFSMSIFSLPNSATCRVENVKTFLNILVEETDKLGVPIVGGHTVESKDFIYTLVFVEISHDEIQFLGFKENKSFFTGLINYSLLPFLKDRLIFPGEAQGCTAKCSPDKFAEIINCAITKLDVQKFSNLHVNEDVVVYNLDNDCSVAFTVDIIKPISNSAPLFGEIAINHAANDLYAKGIFPKGAVGVLYSNHAIQPNVLEKIKNGGKKKVKKLSAKYLGIYGIEARELFYGGVFYGVLRRKEFIENSSVKEGDLLILTKPIGTGVVSRYLTLKSFDLSKKENMAYSHMIKNMLLSGSRMARIIKKFKVSACTDVSGFGLIGHLKEMIQPVNLSARIWLKNVLFLSHAFDFYSSSVYCSVERNRNYFSKDVFITGSLNTNLSEMKLALLYDAQTAGGMMIAAPKVEARKILRLSEKFCIESTIIGEIIKKKQFPIEVDCRDT